MTVFLHLMTVTGYPLFFLWYSILKKNTGRSTVYGKFEIF